MAFVAGFGWRKLGCWADDGGADNAVSQYLKSMWFVFQPILFGLIGTEIQVLLIRFDRQPLWKTVGRVNYGRFLVNYILV